MSVHCVYTAGWALLYFVYPKGAQLPQVHPESLDLGSAGNAAGTAAELSEHNHQHLEGASKYPFPSENEF